MMRSKTIGKRSAPTMFESALPLLILPWSRADTFEARVVCARSRLKALLFHGVVVPGRFRKVERFAR